MKQRVASYKKSTLTGVLGAHTNGVVKGRLAGATLGDTTVQWSVATEALG